jgi:hypothetical protein
MDPQTGTPKKLGPDPSIKAMWRVKTLAPFESDGGSRMKSLFATAFWAAFLVSCGGGGSPGGPMSTTVAGSWHESLTSTGSGRKSTVDLYILQNGTTLSSSRVALGATCSSNGTMSGSVSGDNVAMTITGINGDTINVTGTVSENSSSMSGSYTIKNQDATSVTTWEPCQRH